MNKYLSLIIFLSFLTYSCSSDDESDFVQMACENFEGTGQSMVSVSNVNIEIDGDFAIITATITNENDFGVSGKPLFIFDVDGVASTFRFSDGFCCDQGDYCFEIGANESCEFRNDYFDTILNADSVLACFEYEPI